MRHYLVGGKEVLFWFFIVGGFLPTNTFIFASLHVIVGRRYGRAGKNICCFVAQLLILQEKTTE
jgi:hypothetical protein